MQVAFFVFSRPIEGHFKLIIPLNLYFFFDFSFLANITSPLSFAIGCRAFSAYRVPASTTKEVSKAHLSWLIPLELDNSSDSIKKLIANVELSSHGLFKFEWRFALDSISMQKIPYEYFAYHSRESLAHLTEK